MSRSLTSSPPTKRLKVGSGRALALRSISNGSSSIIYCCSSNGCGILNVTQIPLLSLFLIQILSVIRCAI
jgi:hypothetical protein